jgi:hypothetical protein
MLALSSLRYEGQAKLLIEAEQRKLNAEYAEGGFAI